MISLRLIILGAFVVLFQTTIMKLFEFYQIGPDLCLIFIVWAALQYGPIAGLYSGFIIGGLFDVYSYVDYLGVGMLVKSILGYSIGLADDHVIQLQWTTKVMILTIAFFVHDLVYNLMIGMSSISLSQTMLSSTFPEAIYTVLIACIVFNLYNKKSYE